MSGRPTAQQVGNWADELERVGERLGHRFARSEPRQRASAYLRGLLSQTGRKNGWQLAGHLGDPPPPGFSTCCPAPPGMPMLSRMTSPGTWPSTSANRTASGWWTRRGLEEGHQVGRRLPAVQWHRRAGRELPGRGIPRVPHRPGPSATRSGPVPAAGLGGGPQAAQGGRGAERRPLRNRTGPLPEDDRAGSDGRRACAPGDGRRGPRLGLWLPHGGRGARAGEVVRVQTDHAVCVGSRQVRVKP